MSAIGERQEAVRPEFDKSVSIYFQGATITSDTGFLLFRRVEERYHLLERVASRLDDPGSPIHTGHSVLELLRQRVYQMGAGYEDCNDAGFLRLGPALRISLGKEHEFASGQPTLCRFENDILAKDQGLKALEAGLGSSADTLLRRRSKKRIISDLDSTNDPVHGRQENASFNGYYKEKCYHPLFCFTGHGDLLAAKLRAGHVPSSEGAIHLKRPAGAPPEEIGVHVKVIKFEYQTESWTKPRRVVCKIEWHRGELFPRVGFIVTSSGLEAKHVILVCNGRAEIENRIREGKNTLRWGKTCCQFSAASKARLFPGALTCNLMHLLREVTFCGEKVRPPIGWIIRRLVRVGYGWSRVI